eukprot:8105799-Heterocapsa_arctica.AAC.1
MFRQPPGAFRPACSAAHYHQACRHGLHRPEDRSRVAGLPLSRLAEDLRSAPFQCPLFWGPPPPLPVYLPRLQ